MEQVQINQIETPLTLNITPNEPEIPLQDQVLPEKNQNQLPVSDDFAELPDETIQQPMIQPQVQLEIQPEQQRQIDPLPIIQPTIEPELIRTEPIIEVQNLPPILEQTIEQPVEQHMEEPMNQQVQMDPQMELAPVPEQKFEEPMQQIQMEPMMELAAVPEQTIQQQQPQILQDQILIAQSDNQKQPLDNNQEANGLNEDDQKNTPELENQMDNMNIEMQANPEMQGQIENQPQVENTDTVQGDQGTVVDKQENQDNIIQNEETQQVATASTTPEIDVDALPDVMPESFDEFCRRRFLELIKEKPELAENKDAVAQMLSDEWSQIKKTHSDQLNPETGDTVMGGEGLEQDFQVVRDLCNASPLLNAGKVPYSPSNGKPKKRLFGYLYFVQVCKTGLCKARPDFSWKENMNHVVKIWKSISNNDRVFFDQLEAKDRERFTEETTAYENYIRSNPTPIKKGKKISKPMAPIQQANYQQAPNFAKTSLDVQNQGAGNMSADQMGNPQFLIQMIAQQQQYIQLLLCKQRELVERLSKLEGTSVANAYMPPAQQPMMQQPQMQQMPVQMQMQNMMQPAMPQQAYQPPMQQPVAQQQQQNGAQGYTTPGYYLFLKSLTNEILRRNSSVNLAEMNKIVDREWGKLPDTQKNVYEKLAAKQAQGAQK